MCRKCEYESRISRKCLENTRILCRYYDISTRNYDINYVLYSTELKFKNLQIRSFQHSYHVFQTLSV